jgi:rare lipoprotein A
MTTLGTTTAVQAQQSRTLEPASEVPPPKTQARQLATTPASPQPSIQPKDVQKVGEFQSPTATAGEQVDAIAKIQAYELAGRQAAILYVRDIPVLTFLASGSSTAGNTQAGAATAHSTTKTASRRQASQHRAQRSDELEGSKQYSAASDGLEMENNPIWRATTVAAKLNQLHRDNLDAKAIAVRWNPKSEAYSIEVNGQELVQISNKTLLPDTTRNLAQDALQATNRLRRLMGNAPPLRKIAGIPQQRQVTQVAVGPIRMEISGVASWYGPGFHGNRSASGEIYNQNAMTAAHRSLPFGTRVLVTNMNNGRSTVVRINDRGPFVRGRVIDLSAAAARVLGIVNTGIAPVKLQVLDPSQPQTVATDNYDY